MCRAKTRGGHSFAEYKLFEVYKICVSLSRITEGQNVAMKYLLVYICEIQEFIKCKNISGLISMDEPFYIHLGEL